jgi:hypothetical protein
MAHALVVLQECLRAVMAGLTMFHLIRPSATYLAVSIHKARCELELPNDSSDLFYGKNLPGLLMQGRGYHVVCI